MQVNTYSLFGSKKSSIPHDHTMEIPDEIHPAVPQIKPHIFPEFFLKVLQMWWSPVAPRRNLFVTGNGGVGKTSGIIQFAARMRIPLWSLSASGNTRYEHLLGSMQMVDGNTIWVDGPLMKPYRNGGICLVNELSRMKTGEQMRLVDFLDNQSRVTIAETGEVVERHNNFRFAGSGNSAGYGDESGAYAGEQVSSGAFMDRFLTVEMKPLDEDEELELLKLTSPTLPDEWARGMVALANKVRPQFVGNGGALSFSISPRALIDWASTACVMTTMKNVVPLKDSLDLVVLNGKPKDCRRVVSELFDNWINGSAV